MFIRLLFPMLLVLVGLVAALSDAKASEKLKSGQEFLWLNQDVPYHLKGRLLGHFELSGRTMKLVHLSRKEATFSVEGLGEVVRQGDPSKGFGDLALFADGRGLAALKQKYEGKKVWGYGGLSSECSGLLPGQGVIVRRVARLKETMETGLNGTGVLGTILFQQVPVTAAPLVFLLDAAPFVSGTRAVQKAYAEAPGLSVSERHAHLSAAAEASCGLSIPVYTRDASSAERTFSLTPPVNLHRTPPTDQRGLTHWQYAWLHGFPTLTPGTVGELLRLREWKYTNIPFPATISFDTSGHVGTVDISRLP